MCLRKICRNSSEAIRHDPDKFSFGSAGIGTTPHLSGRVIPAFGWNKTCSCAVRRRRPGSAGYLGGFTPITFSSLPAAVPLIKGGSVRALAVTSPKSRQCASRRAHHGRGGFPRTGGRDTLVYPGAGGNISRHREQAQRRNSQDRCVTRCQRPIRHIGVQSVGNDLPRSLRKRVSEEIARWGKVIKDANIHEGGD